MATTQEMDRIKKLIALSESSNFGDAANAAALASKLLHELNLTIEDVDLEEGTDPLDEYDKTPIEYGGHQMWRRDLMQSICYAFNSRSTWKASHPQFGTLVGRPHEVELAIWTFGYVAGELTRLAKAGWRKDYPDGYDGGWPSVKTCAGLLLGLALVHQPRIDGGYRTRSTPTSAVWTARP